MRPSCADGLLKDRGGGRGVAIPNNTSLNCAKRVFRPRPPAGPAREAMTFGDGEVVGEAETTEATRDRTAKSKKTSVGRRQGHDRVVRRILSADA